MVFQLEVYYKLNRLLTGQLLNKKEQLLDDIQIKHLYNKRVLFEHLLFGVNRPVKNKKFELGFKANGIPNVKVAKS